MEFLYTQTHTSHSYLIINFLFISSSFIIGFRDSCKLRTLCTRVCVCCNKRIETFKIRNVHGFGYSWREEDERKMCDIRLTSIFNQRFCILRRKKKKDSICLTVEFIISSFLSNKRNIISWIESRPTYYLVSWGCLLPIEIYFYF